MLSWLKAKVLKIAEAIHFEPYDKFKRQFFPADEKSLHEKCFEAELDFKRFEIFDGRIAMNRIPREGEIDTGDQAIWHGFYTATAAWRYSVTQKESDLKCLEKYVDGLRMHQPHSENVDGFDGMLCRGVKPGSYGTVSIQWDASNDSACGHLAGLWWAWDHGSSTIREKVKELIFAWASDILYHDGNLVNPDGKPTSYGALDQGIKTDPLRITLLMAIYGAAYRITHLTKFSDAGLRVAKKYHALIPWGKTRIAWLDNHNDTHRAAVQLRIMLETSMFDTWRPAILEGMKKLWETGFKQGNPWIMLMDDGFKYTDTQRMTLGMLSEFDLQKKKSNIGVDNIDPLHPSDTITFWNKEKNNGWSSSVQEWGGKIVARQPLPIWARRSQDFFWQRHPYVARGTLDYWDSQHNMGDFLAVYWLGRSRGILNERD